MGNSDAEVAAGDHDRARRLDDALEVLDGGPGLDLGHDQRAPRVGLGADAADVVGRAHERDGHHVDADLDEGVEHAEVVGGGRGDAQAVRRDVHAGPARAPGRRGSPGGRCGRRSSADDLDLTTAPSPKARRSPDRGRRSSRSLVVDLDDLGRARRGARASGGVLVPSIRIDAAPRGSCRPAPWARAGRPGSRPGGRASAGGLADAVVALEGVVERLVGQADAGHVHAGLDEALERAPRSPTRDRWWR